MKSVFALAFIILAGVSQAQPVNGKKLDSLFDVLSKNDLAMGSIAIARRGTIIYQRGFGNAIVDSNKSIPATVNTEYRIGSITKMFTSVMILQLIEEKKLSLTDTLSTWYPLLPNAKKITIRDMLDHHSGLPDFTKNTDFDNWSGTAKSPDQLLAMISGRAPDFQPGAKADYSNSNYLVLGFILEKISGMSYIDALQSRILDKLGLKKTYFGTGAVIRPGEAASYDYSDSRWTTNKEVDLVNFSGAGAIVSTPADMTRFITGLFTGKLLSTNSLDSMKSFRDWFGKGIFPYSFDGKSGFGHNGKTSGFASSLSYYPDNGFALAYCTNGEIYPKDDIMNAVLAICNDKPYKIPDFEPMHVSDDELNQYVGSYSSADPPINVKAFVRDHQFWVNTRNKDFRLEYVAPNTFHSRAFGYFMEIDPKEKQLIIKVGDEAYYLKKQ